MNAKIYYNSFNYFFFLGDIASAFHVLEDIGYEVFFLIGNEKIPEYRGIGKYNIYHCQFPFDRTRGKVDNTTLKLLTSYDVVWVNSDFTRKWYLRYTSAWYDHLRQSGMSWMKFFNSAVIETRENCNQWRARRWPQVEVLNPPVQVADLQKANEVSTVKQDDCSLIVLVGRVFQGRQSKGHSAAIELLIHMRQEYPHCCFNLAVAGHIMPGFKDYAEGLILSGKHHNVEFHFNVEKEDLYTLLKRARIQWHLTGGFNDESDPASFEHFGISIVEGMSMGVIPVVLNQGGPAEIVTESSGIVVGNMKGFINASVHLLLMDSHRRDALSAIARERAKLYSEESFAERATRMIQRGIYEQSYFKIVNFLTYKYNQDANAPDVFQTFPSESGPCHERFSCAAVIAEFRDHPLLTFAIRNVMLHLGNKWKLYIFTLQHNVAFVESAVASAIPEVKFSRRMTERRMGYLHLHSSSTDSSVAVFTLPVTKASMSTDLYSSLFKREDFWETFSFHHGVLVFQVDSIIVSDPQFPIDHYVKYDYIGAPWCQNNEILRPLLQDGSIKYLVGNGGFSWRTVVSQKECVKEMAGDSPASEPEDRFFVRCFSKFFGKYRVAPVAVAKSFCIEVGCWGDLKDEISEGRRPLALHAAWYYESESIIREILHVPKEPQTCF